MGPSQICGCPFREPRVFTIAHMRETLWNKRIVYTVYTPMFEVALQTSRQ